MVVGFGEIALEDHPVRLLSGGAALRKQTGELLAIAHGVGVPTAVTLPGLQNGREADRVGKYLDVRVIDLGGDCHEGRRRDAARAQSFSLEDLVREAARYFRGVEVKAERERDVGQVRSRTVA